MPVLLKLLVLGVLATALPVVAATSAIDAPIRGDALVLLVALAAIAGAHPVRISSLRCELTATHPAIFCAMAALGPSAAVLTAAAGVLGAAVARKGKGPGGLRLAYNLAAVSLSAAAAAWTFHLSGGRPGDPLGTALGPLTAAAITYFFVNSGLVAAAIALETRRSLPSSWVSSLGWTVPSYFTGLTVAALLLLVLETLGPRGLVLGIPPIWLLVSFYRAHRERVEEQDRRIREVEGLNVQLEERIDQLRRSDAHVRRLQGLLPICMHCKRIRDDHDAWHQIEAYLAEHAEMRFTHSVCGTCREAHYPAPAAATTTTTTR
jgi:hypothetical protein